MEGAFLADVGGTTTRLAVERGGRPEKIEEIANDSVSDFIEAAAAYLRRHGLRPQRAVFAFAGPIGADSVTLTNRAWSLRFADLADRLGVAGVDALNDFEAVAWALPALPPDQLRAIGSAVRPGRGAKVACGPGTGLGVSALVPTPQGWCAIAGEGGHVAFGPSLDDELDVFARLRQSFGWIEAETLLCGPGLERLHVALHPDAPPAHAGEIVEGALRGKPACASTVALFVRLLGRFAGDLALTFKATGGVYLAGGVARKLDGLLDGTVFRTAFEHHPPFGSLLATIPTWLILHPQPGLLGCATYAEHLRA